MLTPNAIILYVYNCFSVASVLKKLSEIKFHYIKYGVNI